MVSIDGHSYVLLVEIIQDCLANNNPYYDLKNCTKEFDANNIKFIWDSKHVKNIIKDIHKPGTKTSDDTKHLMIVR